MLWYKVLNSHFPQPQNAAEFFHVHYQELNCFWILELWDDLPPLSLYEFLEARVFPPLCTAAIARRLCLFRRFTNSTSFTFSSFSSCTKWKRNSRYWSQQEWAINYECDDYGKNFLEKITRFSDKHMKKQQTQQLENIMPVQYLLPKNSQQLPNYSS